MREMREDGASADGPTVLSLKWYHGHCTPVWSYKGEDYTGASIPSSFLGGFCSLVYLTRGFGSADGEAAARHRLRRALQLGTSPNTAPAATWRHPLHLYLSCRRENKARHGSTLGFSWIFYRGTINPHQCAARAAGPFSCG